MATLLLMASCGGEPVEGEIVIRWEDIADDTCRHVPADSVIQIADTSRSDTLYVALAENDSTSTFPDSVSVTDSLSVDSIHTPAADTLQCPWTAIAMEINGSIYASLDGEVDDPDVIGAHVVRCMIWDTDPWRGMNAGDSIYALLGETGRENRIVALRYVPRSGTQNHPFSVYSFTMTGDNFPSYYYASGTEMMKLLNYMPITTFEEMTSPYGEPRGDHVHAGIDLKAPEGTPVRTCRGGRVTRINWNPEYNGNCVEVDIGAGYKEIFLHLESVEQGIAPGAILQRGEVIGRVGNTGVTSTAPHIHYQINDERGNPIDPYLFFNSYRRSLPQSDLDRFVHFRDSCDQWLGQS